jgi:hypothetical protein
MIALIFFVLAALTSSFKSKIRLEAENAMLRQLVVLRRRVRGRAQPTNTDRWFLVQMYRWFPSILKVVTIVQPETLVRWHRPASPLLASEIASTGRATADQGGISQHRIASQIGFPIRTGTDCADLKPGIPTQCSVQILTRRHMGAPYSSAGQTIV